MRRILVVASFALMAFAWSQGPPVKPGKADVQKGGEAKPTPAKPAPTSTSIEGNVASPVNPDASKDASPKTKPESTDEKVARFTLYLVIVGAVQFTAMVAQAIYMARTLYLTKQAINASEKATLHAEESEKENARVANEGLKAAIQSAEAATSGAVATRLSADTAEKSLTLLERPWVTFKVTVGIRGAGMPGQVGVVIANSGRTPAFMKSFGADFFAHDAAVDPPFMQDLIDRLLVAESTGAIAPGDSYAVAAPIEIPDVWGAALYLLAVSRYKDIFDKVHETWTIWRWNGAAFMLFNAPEYAKNT